MWYSTFMKFCLEIQPCIKWLHLICTNQLISFFLKNNNNKNKLEFKSCSCSENVAYALEPLSIAFLQTSSHVYLSELKLFSRTYPFQNLLCQRLFSVLLLNPCFYVSIRRANTEWGKSMSIEL